DEVWNDPNLANAYMANIYPMFGNWVADLDERSQQLVGIHFYPNRITISNGEYKSWDYNRIRLINQAIQDVNQGSLDQEIKDNILGQALFMRAYAYFNMVMYHGGVPYLTNRLNPYENDRNLSGIPTAKASNRTIQDLNKAIPK